MSEIFEIRIHSKSGQGAKTTGQFIVEAASDDNKHVQAYAEFGAERIGAPMVTFARISDGVIKTHAPIAHPDVIMVFDDTLFEYVNITGGLKKGGKLIINTTKSKKHFEQFTKEEIVCVDATKIAINSFGDARPNIPMLGIFSKLTDAIDMGASIKRIKDKFIPKLGAKKTADIVKSFTEGYKSI